MLIIRCKQPRVKQDPKVGRLVAEVLMFRKGKDKICSEGYDQE
jgi:hypothetical protein